MGTLDRAPRLLLVTDVVISVTKRSFLDLAMARGRAVWWLWRVKRPRVEDGNRVITDAMMACIDDGLCGKLELSLAACCLSPVSQPLQCH